MKPGFPNDAPQGGTEAVQNRILGDEKRNFYKDIQSKRSVPLHSERKLNPAVKAWIDNVIVPALLEEWTRGRVPPRWLHDW